MTSSAPAILALETDSAWVVILAVSLVTIVASILMRRLVARPGGTVLVKESDLDNWLTAVEARMAKGGVSAITVKWETRQDWQAVPIMPSIDTGPLGFYRIKQQP